MVFIVIILNIARENSESSKGITLFIGMFITLFTILLAENCFSLYVSAISASGIFITFVADKTNLKKSS
jgi:hypothetical protein